MLQLVCVKCALFTSSDDTRDQRVRNSRCPIIPLFSKPPSQLPVFLLRSNHQADEERKRVRCKSVYENLSQQIRHQPRLPHPRSFCSMQQINDEYVNDDRRITRVAYDAVRPSGYQAMVFSDGQLVCEMLSELAVTPLADDSTDDGQGYCDGRDWCQADPVFFLPEK